MSFEYSENMLQNSIENNPNGVYQLVSPQILQPQIGGCPVPMPFYPVPPQNPMNGHVQQMIPIQYFHQNDPHFQNNPNGIVNEQHGNMPLLQMPQNFHASPVKSPVIPVKRHKFNETRVLDNDSKCEVNQKNCNIGFENALSLEIDSMFYEFQTFSSNALSYAEDISKNYRKRPCFKKIELLMTRLKQEINIYHNITSNINSQGTAWAIKDFIFAIARIVNAWVIMRGYVYDKNKGLDELRKDYDPHFTDSFRAWQEATLKMMKAMMGTVENFDVKTQNKSGNKNVKKEVYVDVDYEIKQYDNDFLHNFQKNVFSPKSDNSHEVQINAHQTNGYFRSGCLKPLQIDSQYPGTSNMEPSTPATPNTDPLSWPSFEDINDSPFNNSKSIGSSVRLYNRRSYSLPATPMDHRHEPSFNTHIKSRAKKDLSSKFNSMSGFHRDIEAELEKEFGELNIKLDANDDKEKTFEQMYGSDSSKITYLMNEVEKLQCDEGYSVCITLIVENIKCGKYSSLGSILDEFNILVKHVKGLINGTNDKTHLKKFVAELEAIISRKAFETIN